MRALLSVYDKTGLEHFAIGLRRLGIEIIASGGTAKFLAAAGIDHTDVAEITKVPEMLDGRVKTLHPAIHAGILADRSIQSHLQDLAAQDITAIDIVVCNLYPFEAHPSVETMDIGGPTMIRAAAKNCSHVAVIVDPSEYGPVLEELGRDGVVSDFTRRRLARAAFAHTAAHDAAIVAWMDQTSGAEKDPDNSLPPTLHVVLERARELRYGENPHQRAAHYRARGNPPGWWEHAVQHGGRELSYLNLLDAEAAWQLAHELVGPDGLSYGNGLCAAAIVKHTNPCGAAVADDLATALERALDGDRVSAFGGIVALSGAVDGALADQIVAGPLADVLIAPAFEDAALAPLCRKAQEHAGDRSPAPVPPRSQPSPDRWGFSRAGARQLPVIARDLAGGDQAVADGSRVARPRACLEGLRPHFVKCHCVGLRWTGSGCRLWTAKPRGRGPDRWQQSRRTGARRSRCK